MPANDVPNVHIPLADKWVHFVMFGLFAFLWSASIPNFKKIHLPVILLTSIFYGWLVEALQGQLSFLGRSQDNMDILADSIGGAIGVIIFYLGYKKTTET